MVLSSSVVLHLWRKYVRLVLYAYLLAAIPTMLLRGGAHTAEVFLILLLSAVLLVEQIAERVADAKSIRRAARLARREHVLFQAAAESSQQPFYVCQPVTASDLVIDYRFTYVNTAAEQLFGKSRLELLGKSASSVLSPQTKVRVMGTWSRVAATGNPETIEMTYAGDGIAEGVRETRVVAISDGIALTVLRGRDDAAVAARTQEMYDFTQAIIQSAPISMIATDVNGTIIAMNSAAEQLTLYRKRDLIGEHSIVLLHDSVELSTRANQLCKALDQPIEAGFQSLIANPQQGRPEEREWTYIRKDGTRVWVSLTMTTLKTSDGKVTGYLGIAYDITERKRLTDSVVHMAHHDQLTGLPNRALLSDRLVQCIERAKRYHHRMAVFMIDIDHFKRINDSLGHAAGDTLLTMVARLLQSAVRSTDTIARVGGDEFVVLMPDFRDLEDARRCASLLLQKLSTPIIVGTREIRVTASIGYCLFPDSAADPTELLRTADIAMYEAKSLGRNNAQYFSAEMERQVAGRLELEEELRYAFGNNELDLYYQPQVSCITGEVVGMELLLRWKSPKRGFVPPSVFIPIAEESGLLVAIGEWAIRQACFDCMEMGRQLNRPLTVAVNLSPRQFSQNTLKATVEEALRDSGLPPNRLEIEITEQILMANTPNTLATLDQMHQLGVNIAIDDFGTGFSSFQYILQYNVDRLKIDQSFVAQAMNDSNAAAVVRTIIAMAHGLKIDVVAEGVETIEQVNFLLRKRCDVAQGFLFSKAVPLDEFVSASERIEAWVSSQKAIATEALETRARAEGIKLLPAENWQAKMLTQ